MRQFILLLLCITLLILSVYTSPATSASPVTFCMPEDNNMLFGAYIPEFSDSSDADLNAVDKFSKLSGKPPAIITFNDEWADNKLFPTTIATKVKDAGATPYIRLMMRSSHAPYTNEPLYTLSNIANGKFDSNLKQWAKDARAFGKTIIMEYGTEVNDYAYPWNGYWNNGAEGNEEFIKAYQHIIEVMNDEGADNIVWVYHIDAVSPLNETWNTLSSYYPGDEYVDWIGVSVYGTVSPYSTSAKSFTEQINVVLKEKEEFARDKPIIISEMGTDVRNLDINPVEWTNNGLTTMYNLSDLVGFIWWNDGWKNDKSALHDTSFKLQDSKELQDLIQRRIGNNSKILEKMIC